MPSRDLAIYLVIWPRDYQISSLAERHADDGAGAGAGCGFQSGAMHRRGSPRHERRQLGGGAARRSTDRDSSSTRNSCASRLSVRASTRPCDIVRRTVMRADRLLSIILLLQSHRRLTGTELARRLEVSARTIHRDMDALSAAGVPVAADRGARGGWTLDPAWKTDLTGLDARELDALFLAPPPRLLANLQLGPAADRAMSKLLLALPIGQRSRARAMRQRLHIDLDGWYTSPEELPVLPIVQQALWRERQLEIVYRTPGRGASTRTIDPLGLVIKGAIWYLVAQYNGEQRTFRVSRVEAARILDTPADRPAQFDLAEYWSKSAQAFRDRLPQYRATLRVDPDAACWMRGSPMWNVEHVEAPDADGWVVMRVCFGHFREACFLALGLGSHGEVLSPQALRDAVRAQAQEVLDRYGTERPPGTKPIQPQRSNVPPAGSMAAGASR